MTRTLQAHVVHFPTDIHHFNAIPLKSFRVEVQGWYIFQTDSRVSVKRKIKITYLLTGEIQTKLLKLKRTINSARYKSEENIFIPFYELISGNNIHCMSWNMLITKGRCDSLMRYLGNNSFLSYLGRFDWVEICFLWRSIKNFTDGCHWMDF